MEKLALEGLGGWGGCPTPHCKSHEKLFFILLCDLLPYQRCHRFFRRHRHQHYHRCHHQHTCYHGCCQHPNHCRHHYHDFPIVLGRQSCSVLPKIATKKFRDRRAWWP